MSDIEAFAGLVDLVGEAVGGTALLTSDDFFAGMENLVKPKPAHWDPTTYTDRGKEMDGWESRRKRVPGHDWCILRLGIPGRIRGVDIDTSYFMGNHPPFASLDACSVPEGTTPEQLRDEVAWTRILEVVPLKRGSHNLQPVSDATRWTHVRLNIYPDGGVARLCVYGDPLPELSADGEIDLAALVNGGRALACSDMFFSPMNNLLLPGRSAYMGGGWETRRSRPPGMDWIIVPLCAPGKVARITLDTGHFKGNFPDRAAVDGLYWPGAPPHVLPGFAGWREVLPSVKLRADAEATFSVAEAGPLTHLRLRILPDGGVARMRVWGTRTAETPTDALVARLNAMTEDEAATALARCCGSRRWVRAMLAGRPFQSRDHLLGHAEVAWWHLGDGDWREAFTHHPRIGADVAALRAKFAATATWSEGEQAGMTSADEATIQALAAGNRAYEERFGHIFIVCATGLSAREMLVRLEERMDNSPANELRIAAGEQAKITALRIAKLAEGA
jgi:allantoicase